MDRKPRCPEMSGGRFTIGDEVYYDHETCNLTRNKPCLVAVGDECEVYKDYLKWLEDEEKE